MRYGEKTIEYVVSWLVAGGLGPRRKRGIENADDAIVFYKDIQKKESTMMITLEKTEITPIYVE